MLNQTAAAGASRDTCALLAITLVSSNAPIAMPAVPEAHLRGLALFKSRRVEDGRERFRLHLGYFSDVAEAERTLALVRRGYPSAMIAAVPDASLGSLDNTAVTRFQAVRPALVPPPRVASEPLPVSVAELRTKSGLKVSEVPRSAQRYAVQLAFGREPIDLKSVPALAVFEGYLLYAIEAEPRGRRLYGLRLGFYDDILSARLVAQYVRSEFKSVSIVPVSEREHRQAMDAEIRLQVLRTAHAQSSTLPQWPRSALMVAFDPGSHLALAM